MADDRLSRAELAPWLPSSPHDFWGASQQYMPRFTTSGSTYGAFYARPQAPSAGVKKPTVAIDNPYANSLVGIDAVLADRGVDPSSSSRSRSRRRRCASRARRRPPRSPAPSPPATSATGTRWCACRRCRPPRASRLCCRGRASFRNSCSKVKVRFELGAMRKRSCAGCNAELCGAVQGALGVMLSSAELCR